MRLAAAACGSVGRGVVWGGFQTTPLAGPGAAAGSKPLAPMRGVSGRPPLGLLRQELPELTNEDTEWLCGPAEAAEASEPASSARWSQQLCNAGFEPRARPSKRRRGGNGRGMPNTVAPANPNGDLSQPTNRSCDSSFNRTEIVQSDWISVEARWCTSGVLEATTGQAESGVRTWQSLPREGDLEPPLLTV